MTIDYPDTSPTSIKHHSARILLATLDPKSIKQINDADGHMVTVERSDGATKVYADIDMGDGRKTFGYESQENLFFDSEEGTQRFAKALSYAITKCGGTSAPF